MKWSKESTLNGILLLIAILPLWELVSRSGLVPVLFFPPMTKILKALYAINASGELPGHILSSLGRSVAGYFLSAIVFISLGILMGYFRAIYNLFEVVIELARPVPPPAIIPMAILFFGIGSEMKVFLIFVSTAWPILLNTIDGVRNVDRVLLHTAHNLGLSSWQIMRNIVIPSASPQIMTGLRISLAIALILVVISEMIGSTDGIGFFILHAQRSFRIPEMYAGMMVLAGIGYGLNRIFLAADNKIMAWHKGLTQREV